MHFSFKKIPKSKEMMHELIEKYFENQLTKEEKLEFDTLLTEDSAFKDEFEFYSELKNAVVVSERQKIKKEIQQFETVANRPVFHLKRYLPYAAVLLVMLSLWFVFFSNNQTNLDLYNSYFEAFPNVEVSNTRSDINEKTALEEAFIAYDLEEYTKANTLFDLALITSKEDYIHFYKAISLMEINQHELALASFESINWSVKYKDKALWFQTLCYIKTNKIIKAKKTLKLLIENGSFKTKEAKELLSKL